MAQVIRRARGRRGERGAELIEFAAILPLLLLLVLGMVDFAFMFQRYEALTNAAREGARVAVLPGYAAPDIDARVQQYATAAGFPAGAVSTLSTPTTLTVGTISFAAVQVDVSYTHNYQFMGPFMAFFGAGSLASVNLTSTSTMRTETQAAGS